MIRGFLHSSVRCAPVERVEALVVIGTHSSPNDWFSETTETAKQNGGASSHARERQKRGRSRRHDTDPVEEQQRTFVRSRRHEVPLVRSSTRRRLAVSYMSRHRGRPAERRRHRGPPEELARASHVVLLPRQRRSPAILVVRAGVRRLAWFVVRSRPECCVARGSLRRASLLPDAAAARDSDRCSCSGTRARVCFLSESGRATSNATPRTQRCAAAVPTEGCCCSGGGIKATPRAGTALAMDTKLRTGGDGNNGLVRDQKRGKLRTDRQNARKRCIEGNRQHETSTTSPPRPALRQA
ncbi:hypothetical protein HPB47_021185 [Ixodes persulcatus]|uniref:Uncharacterized protein n=1 Tax=Ixodes persulcatus TaxID=34615 RepID=A0AC60QFF5_IXOPE|nr:hypothetical protein HPB47_021185 [Ixodes persulcatus]